MAPLCVLRLKNRAVKSPETSLKERQELPAMGLYLLVVLCFYHNSKGQTWPRGGVRRKELIQDQSLQSYCLLSIKMEVLSHRE